MSELGLLLLDDTKQPIANLPFPKEGRAKSYLDASSGTISEQEIAWLKENLKPGDLLFSDSGVLQGLRELSNEIQPVSESGTKGDKKESDSATRKIRVS